MLKGSLIKANNFLDIKLFAWKMQLMRIEQSDGKLFKNDLNQT